MSGGDPPGAAQRVERLRQKAAEAGATLMGHATDKGIPAEPAVRGGL